MAIEFNRYIRGKTLDLHELDNVDTTELLGFVKQKTEIKVLDLGRNSINDEYEEELLKRGIVIIEDCSEEELASDLKDGLKNSLGSYLESGLERCNTSNKSGNVNQVSNSQEKLKSSSKYYICGATVGLVIGLVAAYCLGAAALIPVGVSVAVFIASAVIGALLGAGVGYAVVRQEVLGEQLVKIQHKQSLANSLEQTTMLHEVTSVIELVGWTMQGTTKVKGLSSEIPEDIEVDIFMAMEDSMKDNVKASYHSLYRDLRPCHVLKWTSSELGRSYAFLQRYAGTSQQRQELAEDAGEVGLIDSTQNVGKPRTRGSDQQYSNWNRDC